MAITFLLGSRAITKVSDCRTNCKENRGALRLKIQLTGKTFADAARVNALALKPQVRKSSTCFAGSNPRKTGKSVRGRMGSSQIGGVTSAQACGRFPSRRRPWLSSAHRAVGHPLSGAAPPANAVPTRQNKKQVGPKGPTRLFMVPQIRFERTTPALGERCSIP